MENRSQLPALLRELYPRGLGELLMMGHKGNLAMLGNLVMEKGSLVLKNRELLADVPVERVAPCFDIGIVGAVCDQRGNDWESLTYLGPDHCKIPVNLSSTRHRLLRSIVNVSGEDLISFQGSVYRGFRLLLDAHLLPVILPVPIETDQGCTGLAVADFRYATVPFETLLEVNDLVRASVERYVCLKVEDTEVTEEEFGALFSDYFKQPGSAASQD